MIGTRYAETYLEPCQTYKMVGFAKTVNGSEPLTISAKWPMLDIWQGCENVFDTFCNTTYIFGNNHGVLFNDFIYLYVKICK